MSKKRRKLRGTVQKVIKPSIPSQPEKAQINIHGADTCTGRSELRTW